MHPLFSVSMKDCSRCHYPWHPETPWQISVWLPTDCRAGSHGHPWMTEQQRKNFPTFSLFNGKWQGRGLAVCSALQPLSSSSVGALALSVGRQGLAWPNILGVFSPSVETTGPYQSQLCWRDVAETLWQSQEVQALKRQTPQGWGMRVCALEMDSSSGW